jgi:hypothetical protein
MVKKVLAVVGILVGGGVVWAQTVCHPMIPDSRATYIHGWGQACSDTGAGCRECTNGGDWCVAPGNGTCSPFNQNENP